MTRRGDSGVRARAPRRPARMLATAVVVFTACTALWLAAWAPLASPATTRVPGPHSARALSAARELGSSCGRATAHSGLASPPAGRILGDFTLSYCTRFDGSGIPPGWSTFSGVPGGDPSGLFVRSHVAVAGGHLLIRVAKRERPHSGWATGGICHCGSPRLYGAFFVRSRVSGAGPDEIDLLWPVAHVWPPEIDFNESAAQTRSTTWTVHFGGTDHAVHGATSIDLLRWHTWGVIWTPRIVRFLVDGRPWGAVTSGSEIPHQPMTLDIQNQTFCGRGTECPSRPVTMQVAWVAEYAFTGSRP